MKLPPAPPLSQRLARGKFLIKLVRRGVSLLEDMEGMEINVRAYAWARVCGEVRTLIAQIGTEFAPWDETAPEEKKGAEKPEGFDLEKELEGLSEETRLRLLQQQPS